MSNNEQTNYNVAITLWAYNKSVPITQVNIVGLLIIDWDVNGLLIIDRDVNGLLIIDRDVN